MIEPNPSSNPNGSKAPRPLIHSYGLFWERENVDWGAGRRAGHLKGVRVTARRKDPVNFRDQKGIYVLYDHNFNLVYIGQVGQGRKGQEGKETLFKRLRAHRDGPMRVRWAYFSWFGTLKHIRESDEDRFVEDTEGRVDIATTLDELEAILITAADPLLNRQGGKFKKAGEFKQVQNEPVEPVDREQLETEFQKLTKYLDRKFRNLSKQPTRERLATEFQELRTYLDRKFRELSKQHGSAGS